MTSSHYPEKLLRDYELLLQYFPSHTICRQFILDGIKKWEITYGHKETVSLLEIGPGFGETTDLILEQTSCVCTLVESDSQTAQMLAHNLQRFEERIRIVNEDALEWIKRLEPASYDVFTASWTLHNFPSKEREEFLKDVRRVLRPGGLFIIFDKVLPDDEKEVEKLWEIHTERLQGLDTVGRADLMKDMLTHEQRDAKEPFVWHERELLGTMSELGFAEATIIMRNERDIVFSAHAL